MNKSLVPLYAAMKEAVTNGIIEQKSIGGIVDQYLPTHETEYNPDTDEVGSGKIRYLTPEQIEQLKDYHQKCKNPRSKEILDMWFFSYYACGLRISDIMTLEWEHSTGRKR